jgi:hypothetical protein
VCLYSETLLRNTSRKSKKVWKKEIERSKRSAIKRRKEKENGKNNAKENESDKSKESVI